MKLGITKQKTGSKIGSLLSFFFAFTMVGLLSSLLTTTTIQLNAQDDGSLLAPKIVDISETYLGMTYGVSLPSEDFKSTVARKSSGYAKLGYKASIDGAFIFFRNMGLGWTFGHSRNPLNTELYQSKLEYHLPQGNINGTFTNKSWTNTYLTIGPYFSLPEERFMFDFSFLFGLAYAVAPEVIFNGTFDDQTFNTKFRSDGSIAGALQFAASGNFHIKENLRVFVKGEMFFSEPLFTEITEFEGQTFSGNSEDNYRQITNFIGIGAGFAYEIENKKKLDNRRRQFNKKQRRM